MQLSQLNRQIKALNIGANLVSQTFFLQPALKIYLLQGELAQDFNSEQMDAIAELAPMWALIWSGGASVAKFILENPAKVANKTIIDFAAGSGIVGLTALYCGAKKVYFCDLDKYALTAIAANMQLNQINSDKFVLADNINSLSREIHNITPTDLLFATDVLYDNANNYLIDEFANLAKCVVLAESHSVVKPMQGFNKLASTYIDMQPNLDKVHRLVNIWSNCKF